MVPGEQHGAVCCFTSELVASSSALLFTSKASLTAVLLAYIHPAWGADGEEECWYRQPKCPSAFCSPKSKNWKTDGLMHYLPGSSYNHVTAEGFVCGPSLGPKSCPYTYPSSLQGQDHCSVLGPLILLVCFYDAHMCLREIL